MPRRLRYREVSLSAPSQSASRGKLKSAQRQQQACVAAGSKGVGVADQGVHGLSSTNSSQTYELRSTHHQTLVPRRRSFRARLFPTCRMQITSSPPSAPSSGQRGRSRPLFLAPRQRPPASRHDSHSLPAIHDSPAQTTYTSRTSAQRSCRLPLQNFASRDGSMRFLAQLSAPTSKRFYVAWAPFAVLRPLSAHGLDPCRR